MVHLLTGGIINVSSGHYSIGSELQIMYALSVPSEEVKAQLF